MVERRPYKAEVGGSSPSAPTILGIMRKRGITYEMGADKQYIALVSVHRFIETKAINDFRSGSSAG